MFKTYNKTPFSFSASYMMDQFGADMAVAVVKGTFDIPDKNGTATISETQLQPSVGESFYESSDDTAILYPPDMVVGKKNTDIGVLGSVYTTGGKPARKTFASVRIGSLYKIIDVYGDRFWKKQFGVLGYKKSKPEKFTKLTITPDRLFGGAMKNNKDELLSYAPNPRGTGFVTEKKSIRGIKLPNFENPETPIQSWKDRPEPATFGFANGASGHRLRYAGTYDEEWRLTHFPLFPEDIDLRFFNYAQPELIAAGFLNGGEAVELINLTENGDTRFTLPRYAINFSFRYGKTNIDKTGDLHTIVIEPDLHRFYMVWSAAIHIGKQPAKMKVVKAEAV